MSRFFMVHCVVTEYEEFSIKLW